MTFTSIQQGKKILLIISCVTIFLYRFTKPKKAMLSRSVRYSILEAATSRDSLFAAWFMFQPFFHAIFLVIYEQTKCIQKSSRIYWNSRQSTTILNSVSLSEFREKTLGIIARYKKKNISSGGESKHWERVCRWNWSFWNGCAFCYKSAVSTQW